jgi:hypothetical protein
MLAMNLARQTERRQASRAAKRQDFVHQISRRKSNSPVGKAGKVICYACWVNNTAFIDNGTED